MIWLEVFNGALRMPVISSRCVGGGGAEIDDPLIAVGVDEVDEVDEADVISGIDNGRVA